MNQLNSNVCIDYESTWLNELTKTIINTFYSYCIAIVDVNNDRHYIYEDDVYMRKRFRFKGCSGKLNTVCYPESFCV